MFKVINATEINQAQDKENIISIEFPGHWIPVNRVSPFAKTIENETIKWMKESRLIGSVEEEQLVRDFEISGYAGYSGCMASYDYALLYSKMICLWLLWDDIEAEGISDPLYYKNMVKLISEPAEGSMQYTHEDRFIYAWKHVGDEITRLGASNDLRRRFGTHMAQWIDYACKEVGFLTQDPNTVSIDDVLRAREITIGMYPTSVYMERVTGIELPPEVLKHMKPIYTLISLTVSLVNDMVSVAKDYKKGTLSSNCVLWYQYRNKCSLYDAYKYALWRLRSIIEAYDLTASDILVNHTEPEWKERIRAYFNTLRYVSSGFAKWHTECKRYGKYVLKDGDSYYRVKLVQ